MKDGRNLNHLKRVDALSCRAAELQLACDWLKIDVAANFGGKKGEVVASVHAMPLNLPINDKIDHCIKIFVSTVVG